MPISCYDVLCGNCTQQNCVAHTHQFCFAKMCLFVQNVLANLSHSLSDFEGYTRITSTPYTLTIKDTESHRMCFYIVTVYQCNTSYFLSNRLWDWWKVWSVYKVYGADSKLFKGFAKISICINRHGAYYNTIMLPTNFCVFLLKETAWSHAWRADTNLQG